MLSGQFKIEFGSLLWPWYKRKENWKVKVRGSLWQSLLYRGALKDNQRFDSWRMAAQWQIWLNLQIALLIAHPGWIQNQFRCPTSATFYRGWSFGPLNYWLFCFSSFINPECVFARWSQKSWWLFSSCCSYGSSPFTGWFSFRKVSKGKLWPRKLTRLWSTA